MALPRCPVLRAAVCMLVAFADDVKREKRKNRYTGIQIPRSIQTISCMYGYTGIQVYRYIPHMTGIQGIQYTEVYRQYTGIQRYTEVVSFCARFVEIVVYRYTDNPLVRII